MFLAFVLALTSCKEEQLNRSAFECYSELKGLRRWHYVVDAPVMVQMSGGLIIGTQLKPQNSDVKWGACNLPGQFMRDSLAIYVTGYFLTSDDLAVMNLTPLPFEVTSAKLR
ncbi:hypothetical protein CLV60_10169 [Dyadobacter jiangsuensis]|uniref:Uncharacterized protein n=2 Tax=Dyadobacter jiangsuensis TaxID=1591085 RepID=A0A2P8GIE5_9BACT|nr:hypothetical protein CLV60_10169 [Dyadobacter jiangsuensis]